MIELRPAPPADPQLVDDLIVANRIASSEGIVDGFGHLSVRHDKAPDRYLMTTDVAPGVVDAADIVEFDLDSNAVAAEGRTFYWERYIHGEIYKARPDVNAVIHSHALPLILFSTVDEPLRPVFHMAAFLYRGVPNFDIYDHAGATDLMVRTPALGSALATELGDGEIVLMRGHGATVVGKTMRFAIMRAVYAMHNAMLQADGKRFGRQKFLALDEAAVATENIIAVDRPWRFWKERALRGDA